MPRPIVALIARLSLSFALALCLTPSFTRAESGGAPEFAPGQSSDRRTAVVTRATRAQVLRALARTQAAELDSLGALAAAASPAESGRWQREIEAAKHRHLREEIVLQQDFAVRTGNAALARRLSLRLERLDRANGGVR